MTTTMQTVPTQIPTAVIAQSPAVPQKSPHDKTGSFTFSDLLDVINPLQHIPVVGTIYRELTGDSISPAARIAGDTLYGGVFGFASSIVDSLVEGETGKDIGAHIMATVFGDDDDTTAQTATSSPAGQTSAGTMVAVATTLPAAFAGVSAAAMPSGSTLPATAAGAAAATGPTDYFHALQTGGHAHKAVPLNATIPVPQPGKAAANAPLVAPAPAAALSSGPIVNPVTPSLPPASAPTSLLPQTATQPQTSSSPQAQPITPSAVPTAALPDMMMKALDKYKTLENQRSMALGQTSGVALTN